MELAGALEFDRVIIDGKTICRITSGGNNFPRGWGIGEKGQLFFAPRQQDEGVFEDDYACTASGAEGTDNRQNSNQEQWTIIARMDVSDMRQKLKGDIRSFKAEYIE